MRKEQFSSTNIFEKMYGKTLTKKELKEIEDNLAEFLELLIKIHKRQKKETK